VSPFFIGSKMIFYPYDIETYPNVFTFAMITPDGNQMVFEISDRKNDAALLLQWLKHLRDIDAYLVGYNNDAFDYTVVHELIKNPNMSAHDLYIVAMVIIGCNDRFPPKIWPRDQYVKQLDLYLVNHFNNAARRTSLKVLEFNMRSNNIEDLPYTPGTPLNSEQIDHLIFYNLHDVKETAKFLQHCLPAIEFRAELFDTFGPEVINYNDTKIGKEFFIQALEEKAPGSCYEMHGRKKVKRQTPRDSIPLAGIIFDYVEFESDEFNAVLTHLKTQSITETKKAPELNASAWFGGVVFQFGNGGMHASVDGATILADDDHMVIDLDVTSYYPSLAIANRIYPEHLGPVFCDVYDELKQRRISYAKGTSINKALKLALNGVYGDSNSEYSPFYDPAYTMAITVNGQLLLCMLAEQLLKIPELTLIQVNTDGLTVKVHKRFESNVMNVAKAWEKSTGLDLERADYSRMFIRDVNNYIAEQTNGKLKYKGAYCFTTPLADPHGFDLDWHKNHGGVIIAKTAAAVLTQGVDPLEFLAHHDDPLDFCFRAKIPRSSRLETDDGEILQNVTRYYISTEGVELTKVMPPLPKAPDKERRIGVHVGQKTTIINNLESCGFSLTSVPANIDYSFYLKEIDKLVRYCQKCTI